MKVYTGAFVTGNAAAGAMLAALYTPTRRVRLLEVHVTASGTAMSIRLQRNTSRGVPTNTITPESQDENDEVTAVVLDRTFSTNPGDGNVLAEASTVGTPGATLADWEFYDQILWVPAGTGVGLKNISGLTAQGHETFWVWEE